MSQDTAEMNASSGYQGQFGKVSVWDFFQQKDWYAKMFLTGGDPRTNNKFLLETPEPALIIIASYLVFVVVAPKVMEKREPFNLRGLIIVYNFALVALSGYMAMEFFLTSYLLGYSYACQGVDWSYSTDPISMRLTHVTWMFYFSKILELADTVFFILRKKNNQVTFLHVYHHATMIANWWMAAKYIPTGQSFFVGMINSSIHALMYMYYGLTAMGPRMQKYLWWKKYMTSLQLIQFIAVISHTGYNKFVRTDCDYPFLYNSIVFYYTISMVVLFSDFYYRTYMPQKKASAARPTKERISNNNGYVPDVKASLLANGDQRKPPEAVNGEYTVRSRRN